MQVFPINLANSTRLSSGNLLLSAWRVHHPLLFGINGGRALACDTPYGTWLTFDHGGNLRSGR